MPLAARIFALADAFDAMTNDRVYQGKLSVGLALDELERCAGTQFDPYAVAALVSELQQSTAGGRLMRPKGWPALLDSIARIAKSAPLTGMQTDPLPKIP